jgi:hypothetical protein
MIRHWLRRIVVASAIAVALMLVGLIALVIWFEATTEFTGIAQTPEQSEIWNLPIGNKVMERSRSVRRTCRR